MILGDHSAVPAWVREMSDEDAYMALVTANAQSELHPLEVGMHALKSGKTIRDYSRAAGFAENTIGARVKAARVASVTDIGDETKWSQLVEIHAAPSWLWPALVSAVTGGGLTVEQTRSSVKAVAGASEPPAWADAGWTAVCSPTAAMWRRSSENATTTCFGNTTTSIAAPISTSAILRWLNM